MANLSATNIRFLGIAGLVVVTAGGIVLGVVPLLGQVGGTNEDIDAANQQTTQLQQQITTLRSTASNVGQIDTFRDQFVEQFPETAQVPDLINTIAAAAVSAGIPASNITNYGFEAPQAGSAATGATGATGGASTSGSTTPTTSPSTSTGGTTPATSPAAGGTTGTTTGGGTTGGTPTTGQAASMTLNLTVSGNPRQFATFMSNLTSMDRNFTVKTFAIAGGTEGSDTLTLTGQTYLYSHITTPNEVTKQSGSGTGSATSSAGSTGSTTGSSTTSTVPTTSN